MLPGKKIGPTDIVQAVRRRIWLIALPPLFAFFGALLYSSTLPDLYQSDMLIAIDPQRVPESFVRSTVTMQTDRRMDALTVQVLSRTVLQQLVEKFDPYPEARRTMPMEDVVQRMRNDIRVDLEIPRPRWGQMAEPSAFHVRFTHTSPSIAASVTQELGQRFVEQNIKDRGSLAGATNRFLEEQLAEARVKLEDQERKLETFRRRYGKELPTQSGSNMQALTSAQTQAQNLIEGLARDRDRKLLLERLYREAATAPPSVQVTAPAAPGSPQVPATASMRQQLADARASLTSLRLRYKSDHPDVARAERLVAELEPKAAAEEQEQARLAEARPADAPLALPTDPARRESLRQMRAEMESIDRQIAYKESAEARLRVDIAEYLRRLEAVPGLESEWTALTRDYDTEQQNYRDLLAKSTAAQVSASLEKQDIGERFRIVDPAAVPVHPLPAMRARINGAGLVIGLLFGLAIAAALELKDSSFRTDQDVMETLSMPVLVVVPRIITADDMAKQRRRRLAFSVAGVACLAAASYVTWTLKLWNSLV